jgi:hypothetical protein
MLQHSTAQLLMQIANYSELVTQQPNIVRFNSTLKPLLDKVLSWALVTSQSTCQALISGPVGLVPTIKRVPPKKVHVPLYKGKAYHYTDYAAYVGQHANDSFR